jgi:Tol biopolymer transport system component
MGFVQSAQAAFPGTNGKIAFSGGSGITTMNPDGTGVTAIGQGGSPAWSADGRGIAFVSSSDRAGSGIYVMNADGSGPTRLSSTGSDDRAPAWSPNGSKIVFHSFRDGDPEIYVMDADGGNQTRLTNHLGWDAEPAWSPDGAKIAFERGSSDTGRPVELYVMNADGTGLTVLPTALREIDCPPTETIDGSPNWSGDGQRLVFHHLECGGLIPGSINTIYADGSGEQVVVQADVNESILRPAWSPDGTKIVYDGGQFVFHVYTINPDGTGRTELAAGGVADWQPLPPLGPQRSDYKNAAHFCKALREFLGDGVFRTRFGGGANAHGKCVSGNGR